ncbi:MAG: efflux RND transporter permease subunit [Chloroflexi bacterium]|nr:efflux RND transporter permease subunit [Chloroflexota bacterium]
MGLTRIAINRPLFILMVILAMVIMGAISYTRLNVELFPNINNPVITVITGYPGAAPEDVERLVTKPIEDAVSGIANVDVVSSSSTEGRSMVMITFTDKANTDIAATDVERRVSSIRAALPADVTSPSVLKLDVNQQAIQVISLAGARPLDQLFQFGKDVVKPRLEAADGVGSVTLSGGLERELKVKVDPERLRSYGLSLDQIQAALARENLSLPGGSIDRGSLQVNVRLAGLYQSPDELRSLIISQGPSGTVLLRDVAAIEDGFKRVSTITRLNGENTVTFSVIKQASANEVRTADAVRAEVKKLQASLPPGVTLTVISDQSLFTRTSINSVNTTLLEAVALTGLVLLLFLHTLRSTIIVLFAIPTSLISTFFVMNLLGFSLNIMSTLALVLVVGVLVDDSIVVLENIVRHLELGETPWTAALKGRSEIGLAAIAITLVDVVIFAPISFLTGTTGGFFRQFGLVIVISVLISLFVSFTLTPMLASRWLKAENVEVHGHGPWAWFVRQWEAGFETLKRGYRRLLGWALKWRFIPPAVALASLAFAFAMVPMGWIKGEFVPQFDNGLFLIFAELPPGSSLAATDEVMRQIDERLAPVPEVQYTLSTSGIGAAVAGGVTSGSSRFGRTVVVLEDAKVRQAHGLRNQFAVIEDVNQRLQDIPGASQVRVQTSGAGGPGQPIQVRVTGDDLAVVNQLAAQVEEIVKTTPGATGVTNSGVAGNPEVRLVVDRQKAADFGINAQQIGLALRTIVEGTVVSKLRPTGVDEIDIRLIASDAARSSVESVAEMPITIMRNGQLVQVKLGQVVKVEAVAGATSLDRRNRQRIVTIGAGLEGTTPLNVVSGPINAKIAQLRASGAVPTGYAVQVGGQAQEQAEAFGQLFLAMGLSIVLMYMLLVALYESLILPLATMFALPVAVVGAFVALAVTGNTLNLLVMIGLIVLMGLVGKNGILLVDYTNTLRGRGLSRTEALLEAGPTRLRPILMTSLALIVGLLPLAAKIHEGSEIWSGIGVAIIGGMISSTLLSLVVVPTMYTYFDDLQMLTRRLAAWRPLRRRAPVVAPAPRPAAQADRPAHVSVGSPAGQAPTAD